MLPAQPQAEIERWIASVFGQDSPRFQAWFEVDRESSQGVLSLDDTARLVSALLCCPQYAYHFDVHPVAALKNWSFEVYVEPAGTRQPAHHDSVPGPGQSLKDDTA